jgi:hypothetical protein
MLIALQAPGDAPIEGVFRPEKPDGGCSLAATFDQGQDKVRWTVRVVEGC